MASAFEHAAPRWPGACRPGPDAHSLDFDEAEDPATADIAQGNWGGGRAWECESRPPDCVENGAAFVEIDTPVIDLQLRHRMDSLSRNQRAHTGIVLTARCCAALARWIRRIEDHRNRRITQMLEDQRANFFPLSPQHLSPAGAGPHW